MWVLVLRRLDRERAIDRERVNARSTVNVRARLLLNVRARLLPVDDPSTKSDFRHWNWNNTK